MLIKAGADLEGFATKIGKPLHLAARQGHVEVSQALTEAGASIDSRVSKGETPLLLAAQRGYVGTVRELLRAKADPTLAFTNSSGIEFMPLDAAALNGHSGVVRELVKHCGTEGCGGASGGVNALIMATQEQHVHVMAILAQAGAVDTGEALIAATRFGGEAEVRLLLQQQSRAK